MEEVKSGPVAFAELAEAAAAAHGVLPLG